MIKVTNLMGRPRCFTLANNSTLRLTAYGSKEIPKRLKSTKLDKDFKDSLINIQDVEELKKPKNESKPKK